MPSVYCPLLSTAINAVKDAGAILYTPLSPATAPSVPKTMPHNNHSSSTAHAGASPGDDLGSTDEVKVFKDEGDKEDENISSENLLEEKSSLIDLTESEVSIFIIQKS